MLGIATALLTSANSYIALPHVLALQVPKNSCQTVYKSEGCGTIELGLGGILTNSQLGDAHNYVTGHL